MLETPAYAKHKVIIDEFVIRYGGIPHKAPAGQAQSRPVVEWDGKYHVGDCICLISKGGGVDRRIGRIVGPPLLAYRQADGPRQAGPQHRVVEFERETATDAAELIALPRRRLGFEALAAQDGEYLDDRAELELKGRSGGIFHAPELAVGRQVPGVLRVVLAEHEGR